MSVTVADTDYRRVREDAGLVDRFDRGRLLLSGAEVAEFLQGQLTNDVEALVPGTGCYALLLTHKGKIRADVRVLRGEDWFLLDSEGHALPALLHTIRTYSIGRDVRVTDVSAERAQVSLLGPRSRDRLDASPAQAEHSFVEGRHGLYVATDLGVDVIGAAESIDSLAQALGVEPVAEETAECLRIESGRPRHGRELDESTIPQEAGLNERAVSFEKGCYVGQETVARLHYKGKPNRHLRALRLSVAASRGDEVRSGERTLGVVGSACESPVCGPIALAILRREAGPGSTVEVGAVGAPAEVVDPPLGRD